MTVAAVVVVAASGAFACLDLATLNLSAISGTAGARITATGAGYSTTAPVLPVVLRWNGTEGPELARALPNAKGEISVQYTVPAGEPGYYVVVGVQRDAAGVDRYGTPSRASYQILGPGGPAEVASPPLAVVGTEKGGDGLPAPAVALALLLLVGVGVGLRRHAGGR